MGEESLSPLKNTSAKLIDLPANNTEQLFVQIVINNEIIVIGGVYIPPASDVIRYDDHVRAVEYISDNINNPKWIICGDYNLPLAIWYNDDLGLNVDCPINSPAITLLNCFSFHNLYQINTVPNNRGIYLDLIFCSFKDIYVQESIDPLLPNSTHHTSVTFDLILTMEDHLHYEENFFDFRNGNYFGLNDFLASIDWVDTLDKTHVNVAVQQFYYIMYSGLNMFIPIKKFKTSSFPHWFSSQLKKTITEKKKFIDYLN